MRSYLLKMHRVRIAGNPQASRTILFAHGFGSDQTAWAAVAAAFAADCRLILFDCLGAEQHDPNVSPDRYQDIAAYADDLLAICSALDLRDVIAVGHSVGAMVCALAAIRAPGHFSRLVMIGASAHYLEDGDYHGGFTRKQIDAIYRDAAFNLSRWADRFAETVVANQDRPQLARDFAESIRLLPPGRVLISLCAIFELDLRHTIGLLALPTLIIQTRNDPAVPIAAANFLHQQIRHSRLVVIDAEGHLPHLCSPDVVIAAIRDFIDLDGAPPGQDAAPTAA